LVALFSSGSAGLQPGSVSPSSSLFSEPLQSEPGWSPALPGEPAATSCVACGALRSEVAVELARTARSREHWLLLLGAVALPIVLLGLGRALHPDPRGFGTHEQLGFKACLPMRLWNFPCPGCGVTTSIALMAHGRPLAALRTQPFGPIVLATALAVAVWSL